MAGTKAGGMPGLSWYYRVPDKDLTPALKPDFSVSTSMKQTSFRPMDNAEAGRAAIKAGLPAVPAFKDGLSLRETLTAFLDPAAGGTYRQMIRNAESLWPSFRTGPCRR